jgi:hypothetical protein
MRLKNFLIPFLALFAQTVTGASVGSSLPVARQRHENEPLPNDLCPSNQGQVGRLAPGWFHALMTNNPDVGTMDTCPAEIDMDEKNEEKCPADSTHNFNVRFFTEDQAARKVNALSKTVKCMVTQSMTQRLKTTGQDEFLHYLEKRIPVIRELLPTLFPPKLLLPILSDPDFSIRLCFNPELKGTYTLKPNVVWLFIMPYWTDAELRSVLKNELHHALVRYHNVNSINGGQLSRTPEEGSRIIEPFLHRSRGYAPDTDLINKHNKALKDGFAQLEKLKKIVKKSQGSKKPKLSLDEKAQLEAFKEIISHYEPQVHRTKFNKADISAEQLKAANKQISANGFYSSTIEGQPVYFRELYESDDGTMVSGYYFNADNSWQAKAKALFMDIKSWQDATGFGPYKKDRSERKDAELSSYLQELPQAVLRFIFTTWCQYFDDYRQLDDGAYCAEIHESAASVRLL